MRVFRSVASLAALGVLAASMGCGSKTATPTAPTYASFTDVFSDGLLLAGARQETPDFGPAGAPHKFTVHEGTSTFPGSVSVTVTFLNPTNLVFGIGLTTFNASTQSCNLPVPFFTFTGTLGQTVTASTSTPGDYCVALFDTGNVVGSATYTVSVTHN